MSWVEEKTEAAAEILSLLYENRMIRTFFRDKPDGWTLISGLYSPLYIQLRPLVSFPSVFEKVCRAMVRMLTEEAPEINKLVGIAMAGVPIAAGMALVGGISAGFTRKMENVKSLDSFWKAISSYGEHSLLEGELNETDNIALVDDLVTRFDSKLVAMEQVKHEARTRGLSDVQCRTVAVVLDREQGGMQAALRADVNLLSLISFKTDGLPLLETVMNRTEWETLVHYLEDPQYFQDKEVQERIARLSPAGGI
jgi:orotate phosphoribosyltransferase